MKGNALRRFIAVFIVVAMMLTPVLALAEEADLGIEAPVAETGATLGEETTTDNAPEGESAPVEAESASVDDADSEEYDIEITKAGTYSKTVNVGDTISASLDMDDVEIVSCSATGSNVIEMDYDETSIEIEAVGAGSAKVTAKLSNKKTVTISVKVVNPYEPKKVSFAESTYLLAEGDLLDLWDEVEYEGITTLTFSSNKTSVASVNKTTGEVVGKKAGSATITVKTSGGKSAKCTVKVLGNEIKNLWKKPSKSQILEYCEGGWTFVPLKIRYNVKTGCYDCQFYLLNGTTSKTKAIENLNISLLNDGDVIAEANVGTKKIAASKYGYKKFDVSMKASEVVFLPYCQEDLRFGYDEDIVAIANDKYQTELEFIPVPDIHEEGSEPGPTPPTPTPTKVTSVTLSKTSTTLDVGEKETLVAAVKPDNATDKTLNWKSDDEKVATVVDGVVTAVAEGTANITATAKDGSGKFATCAVTVSNIVGGLIVTVEPATATLKVGETKTLTAGVQPPECKDSVVWASSDETIAKVDSKTGEVTAKKAGEATIIATAKMGDTTKSASCTVTVEGTSSKVVMEQDTAELVFDSYIDLKATAPAGQTITWSSGNTNIAEVDRATGRVKTPDKAPASIVGKMVNIFATVGDDTATCVVTIVPKTATAYTLSATEVTVTDGGTPADVTINVTPTGSTAPAIDVDIASKSRSTVFATCVPDSTSAPTKFTITAGEGTTAGTVKFKLSATGFEDQYITANVNAAKVYPAKIKTTADLETSGLTLTKGEVGQVEFTLTGPGDPGKELAVTEKGVKFVSSNTTVAEYNETKGVIEAKNTGSAYFTVYAEAAAGTDPVSTGFTVTVNGAPTEKGNPAVTEVKFATTTYNLNTGFTTVTLRPTITPNNAEKKAIVWSYDAPADVAEIKEASAISGATEVDRTNNAYVTVASVENGKAGTFTIIAKSAEDGAIFDMCTFTIAEPAKTVSSIAIDKKTSTDPDLDIGTGSTATTLQLKATVTFSDKSVSDTEAVTWTSLNPTIATIDDNGLVTALAKGTFTVRAAFGGKTYDKKFSVAQNKHVTAITVTPSDLTVEAGKSASLSVSITPSDAVNRNVRFSSLNTDFAKVNATTGVVKGVAKGTTTIIVTSVENPNVTAECNVTVTQPVNTVTLSVTGLDNVGTDKDPIYQLNVGKSVTVTATIAPSDASDKTVTWTTDLPKKATVSDTGVVTGVDETTTNVTITATSNSNKSKKGTIKFKIVKPAKINAVEGVTTNLNSDKSLKVSWKKATAGGDHYWVYLYDSNDNVVYKTHVDDINTTTVTIPVKDGSKEILKAGNQYTVGVQTTIGLNSLDPNFDDTVAPTTVSVDYFLPIGQVTGLVAAQEGADVVVTWTEKTATTLGDSYKVDIIKGSNGIVGTKTVKVGTHTATFVNGAGQEEVPFVVGTTYTVEATVLNDDTPGTPTTTTFTYEGPKNIKDAGK